MVKFMSRCIATTSSTRLPGIRRSSSSKPQLPADPKAQKTFDEAVQPGGEELVHGNRFQLWIGNLGHHPVVLDEVHEAVGAPLIRDPRIGRYVAVQPLRRAFDTPELRDRFSRLLRALQLNPAAAAAEIVLSGEFFCNAVQVAEERGVRGIGFCERRDVLSCGGGPRCSRRRPGGSPRRRPW